MKQNVPLIQPNPEWPLIVFYPDFESWVAKANYKFGRQDYEAAVKIWAREVVRRGNVARCLEYTKRIRDYHESQGSLAGYLGGVSIPMGFYAVKPGAVIAASSGVLSWWHGDQAIHACDVCDPLFLDLNGNAIKTVGVQKGTFFDYNGDGFAELSGWVSPGEGQLCIDRNGNETIDNGSELFSSFMQLPNGQLASNGFQALAALDGNQDGKIDALDPAYSQLRVWANSSGDGNWQQDELLTLPQLGITSIDLNWTAVNTTDAQGNIEMSAGSFQWADGTTSLIAEYTFQTQPWNTVPIETPLVPADIAALPDITGSGTAYDLQQAMVRDTSGRLESLVKQFAAENDPNIRTGLMDQILFQWTDSVENSGANFEQK